MINQLIPYPIKYLWCNEDKSKILGALFYYLIRVVLGKEFARDNGLDTTTINVCDFKITIPYDGLCEIDYIFKEENYETHHKVASDDIIIDVGAHVGLFVLKSSKAKLILAIEPFDYSYELLLQNIYDNKLKNVEVRRTAVSNYEGKANLVIGKSSLAPSIKKTGLGRSVSVTTLDKLVKDLGVDRVNFVKINAEGAELEILKGMGMIIDRFSPDFAISTNHYPEESHTIKNYLEKQGYSVNNDEKSILYAVMKQ